MNENESNKQTNTEAEQSKNNSDGSSVLRKNTHSNYVKKVKQSAKSLMKSVRDIGKKACTKSSNVLHRSGVVDKAKQNKPVTFILLSFSCIAIIAFLIIIFSGHHHKVGPNPVSNLIKINSIQAELNTIQNTVTTTSQMNAQEKQALENKLQEINEKLSHIVSSGDGESASQQVKKLQAALRSNKANLTQKIAILNKEIHRIKLHVFPAPVLSARVLPFKVISIDPWNGKPYAEVMQRSNNTMISYVGLYQTMGGWKVIDINAAEQTARFINRRGQVVYVHVKEF